MVFSSLHVMKENRLARQFLAIQMLSLPLDSIVWELVSVSGCNVGSIFVSGLNIYSRLSHRVVHDCW